MAVSMALCSKIILRLPVKVSLSAEFPHSLHTGKKSSTGHCAENAVALVSL